MASLRRWRGLPRARGTGYVCAVWVVRAVYGRWVCGMPMACPYGMSMEQAHLDAELLYLPISPYISLHLVALTSKLSCCAASLTRRSR